MLAGQIPTGVLYRFKAPCPVTGSQCYLIPSSFFCENLVMSRNLDLKVRLLSFPPIQEDRRLREWAGARGAKAPSCQWRLVRAAQLDTRVPW